MWQIYYKPKFNKTLFTDCIIFDNQDLDCPVTIQQVTEYRVPFLFSTDEYFKNYVGIVFLPVSLYVISNILFFWIRIVDSEQDHVISQRTTFSQLVKI